MAELDGYLSLRVPAGAGYRGCPRSEPCAYSLVISSSTLQTL
jgi:hypothetical protein